MFQLASRGVDRGRVVVFVPRWLPVEQPGIGLPYRVYPPVSALLGSGHSIDLLHEVHERADGPEVERSLAGATAAVAWLAELNPAQQIPGVLAFLDKARRSHPSVPRLCGGGFVSLLPASFDGEELAEFVRSEEVGALASAVAALRGEVVEERQPFSADALYEMDLERFSSPCPLLFRNHEPTLQIPTGSGCGKHCAFCFFEPTKPRLMPAAGIADLMLHCHRRHGFRQFLLGELDFLSGPRRALDLAERLRAAALGLRWFTLASVQDILAIGIDGLRHLAAAGLECLEVGSETGTDDGLRRLGKSFDVAAVLEVQRRLHAVGIRPVHNILLGWVGETAAHQEGTRRLVRKLEALAPESVFHFRLYQPIPGTPMGDQALASSPPVPNRLSELLSWRQDQQRSMPWLTPPEEERARLWCDRFLPLAFGEDTGDHSFRRRWLERIARFRCQTGLAGLRLEASLFAGADRVRPTWLA